MEKPTSRYLPFRLSTISYSTLASGVTWRYPTEQGKEHTAAPTDPTASADKNGPQSYRHQYATFTTVLAPEFRILQEYFNLGWMTFTDVCPWRNFDFTLLEVPFVTCQMALSPWEWERMLCYIYKWFQVWQYNQISFFLEFNHCGFP